MAVLSATNDPGSSAETVAMLAEADPGLTARIMRLANSAYYHRSEPVRSARQAIVVVGFSTVGALAALAATNTVDGSVPSEFWEHSLTTAAACTFLAPRLGVDRPAAFTAGLLHDIGLPLLYQADPDAYAALPSETSIDPAELSAQEIALFGIDHCEAAAIVLKAWKLPEDIVTAVANHHKLMPTSGGITRATVAGSLLAELALGNDEPPSVRVMSTLLEAASITDQTLPGILATVRERAAPLRELAAPGPGGQARAVHLRA